MRMFGMTTLSIGAPHFLKNGELLTDLFLVVDTFIIKQNCTVLGGNYVR